MITKIEIPEIVHLLTLKMTDLVAALGLDGHNDANDFVAYNPTRQDNHLGSFRICVRGAKIGVWKEFSGDIGGDALELINYCLYGGADKNSAIIWAKKFLGLETAAPGELKKIRAQAVEFKEKQRKEEQEAKTNRQKFAQRLYFGAQTNLLGTPVDEYLHYRHIDLRELEALGRLPKSFRFAPECWHSEGVNYPAMIAAIFSPENEFMAVHRTYLVKQNGVYVRKDKRVLGDFAGCAIRCWRGDTKASVSDLLAGKVAPTRYSDTLVLTEGIEDALSVALACPQYRIWATISVGNMKNIIIPRCFKKVIICADNDKIGSPADNLVTAAAELISKRGFTVTIARSQFGKDFNDQLRA